jgi:hypothetical protein
LTGRGTRPDLNDQTDLGIDPSSLLRYKNEAKLLADLVNPH